MNWKPITTLPPMVRLQGAEYQRTARPVLIWALELSDAGLANCRLFDTGLIQWEIADQTLDLSITHWCEITAPEGVQQ